MELQTIRHPGSMRRQDHIRELTQLAVQRQRFFLKYIQAGSADHAILQCLDQIRLTDDAASGCIDPVSYTHLDVYKRQSYDRTYNRC